MTSVFEHPLTNPPTTTVQLYRDKREMAGTKVVIDFGLWGALTPISLDQMEGQRGEGAPGFKAFVADSEPAYPRADDGALLAGMRTAGPDRRRRPQEGEPAGRQRRRPGAVEPRPAVLREDGALVTCGAHAMEKVELTAALAAAAGHPRGGRA